MIECIGHTTTEANAKIENKETAGSKMAIALGRLRFTGVTVDSPENCKVNGESPATITTEPLEATVGMGGPNGEKSYVTFKPTNSEGIFVTFSLTNCAGAIKLPVKGAVVGEAVNPTGTEVASQGITFSKAIQETGGDTLTVGSKVAFLTGRVNNELVSGKAFGVK